MDQIQLMREQSCFSFPRFRRSPSCRWDQSWSLTQGGCEIHLSDHPKLVERVTKTIIPNLSPKLVKTSHQNNHSKLVKSSHQKVIKVSKSPNRWSTCVFRLLQSGTINKNAIRGMLMICFEIENKNPNIPCQRQQRRSRHRGWCASCAGNRFPPSADAFEQTHCSPSMLDKKGANLVLVFWESYSKYFLNALKLMEKCSTEKRKEKDIFDSPGGSI